MPLLAWAIWRITATVQEHQTTGRQWPSNILAFQCQIFAGSQPPGRTQKNTTVISSNPQMFRRFFGMSYLKDYATMQEQPRKTMVGSDPQIFRHFSATYLQDYCHQGKRAEKNSGLMRREFSQAYSHHTRARTPQKHMVSNDHQTFSPFQKLNIWKIKATTQDLCVCRKSKKNESRNPWAGLQGHQKKQRLKIALEHNMAAAKTTTFETKDPGYIKNRISGPDLKKSVQVQKRYLFF